MQVNFKGLCSLNRKKHFQHLGSKKGSLLAQPMYQYTPCLLRICTDMGHIATNILGNSHSLHTSISVQGCRDTLPIERGRLFTEFLVVWTTLKKGAAKLRWILQQLHFQTVLAHIGAFPNKCAIKHPFQKWKVWKFMKTTSLCSVWKKNFLQYYINFIYK
jgi:hypothetical protein